MGGRAAIGIDLGTTNSVVARVNESKHTEIVRDAEGNLAVPSVVWFDDERYYVGEEARLRSGTRPERLIARAKRNLGELSRVRAIEGVSPPAELVEACILYKLQTDIRHRVGNDFGAVIAVPAFFGELQRKATADAAEIAGIPLLDLLNEPTAAALAFSEFSGYLSPAATEREPLRVLVFDLGGFSFEVTLLELADGGLQTMATEHDLLLGGHDWDFRLADYAAERFLRQHGADPREQPASLERLLAGAEHAKRALGLRRGSRIAVSVGGQEMVVPVTRELLDELTGDLLERTTRLADKVLAESRVEWSAVDHVLLVGGATRLPAIRHRLAQKCGREPEHSVNAEEAVARGAAIYASHELAREAATGLPARFRITNVASHNLGIQGVDQRTGERVNKVLIPRGQALPAQVSWKFVTRMSAQKSITLTVLEGDDADPDGCRVIGRATIKNLPPDLSEDWPVDVTLRYSAAGRLQLDAHVRYTDREVHLELTRSAGLTAAQVAAWREVLKSGGGWPAIRTLIKQQQHPPIAVATSEAAAEEEVPDQSLSALARRYAAYVLHALRPAPKGGDASAEGSTPSATMTNSE